jgi:hypothetical protein
VTLEEGLRRTYEWIAAQLGVGSNGAKGGRRPSVRATAR